MTARPYTIRKNIHKKEHPRLRIIMFLLGSIILISWVFCNFYYEDMLPRSWSVYMMFAGLFAMGWGLLKGKQF